MQDVAPQPIRHGHRTCAWRTWLRLSLVPLWWDVWFTHMEGMRVTFLLMLPEFRPEYHLNIDMGIIPRLLRESHGWNVVIASEEKHELPSGMVSVGFGTGRLDSLKCVWWNAKAIDVLQLMHFTWRTVVRALVYKLGHRSGICYVKLDLGEPAMRDLEALSNRWYWRWVFSVGLRVVDMVSAESTEMRSRFEGFMRRCLPRVHKHPQMILLPACGFPVERVLKRAPVPQPRIDILYVGRIGAWQKGTEVLLEAFRLAVERHGARATLQMVGRTEPAFDGIFKKWQESVSSETKSLVCVHPPIVDRDALIDIYLNAKVLAISSRYEGVPNVLLEALACGCRIVATPVGQVPDALRIKERGWQVPIDDPVSFAEALAAALREPDSAEARQRRIIDFGREYSWTEHVAGLATCLLNIAEAKRP